MAHLSLALLGPFQATLDGERVRGLDSDHLRALLAYLAIERGCEHSREALAALLWPERPDREALTALRCALSNLRVALGDRQSSSPFLLITRGSVQFNPGSACSLDVVNFQTLAARSDVASLEQAQSLYRGPFLHGLSVADSPALDEWLLLKEEEYRRRVLSVLEYLTSFQASCGEYGQAARWARRQLELEPYRESAHRQLMAALALGGERPAALAQYETCRRVLADELGCEPDDETQALHGQIRDGNLPQPALFAAPPPGLSTVEQPPQPHGAQRSFEFVAREGELAHLNTLLERALDGRGGVALISGEAGSGKTTLLDEFARRASHAHGDLIALRGQCNSHGGAGDPYLPFREVLQALAGDVEGRRAGGALSTEAARRVWEALPAVGAALLERGPDLINTFIPGEALLRRAEGFPASAATGASLTPLTSRQAWVARLRQMVRPARENTLPASGTASSATAPQADLFGQVTQVLTTLSARRALLLVLDDLQWADDGTAALLFHLGRRLAGSRILLACAFRPEALQEPQGIGSVGSVLRELTREWGDVRVDLDRADGRRFVEAYVDSEPNCLDAAFRQALFSHTDGNPLFTTELLRSFERDGTLVRDEAGRWVLPTAAGPDWESWPPQVEAVIAGHLAGLRDEDRALLQAASVQGEQFTAEVAAQVLGWDEEAALGRLSGPLRILHRLVEAVSLERLASSGQASLAGSGQRLSNYRFRHVLVQRSAYGSLDAVTRARLHEATARTLEAFYAAEVERPLVLAPELARHYEAAGMPLQAARALLDAGHQTMRLSAYRQALDLFDHGLELLAHEPASAPRTELEQLLEVARLVPQRNLSGMSGAQFEDALKRAREAGAGDTQGATVLQVLSAEADELSARGQNEAALALATRMHDEAAQRQEERFLAIAHWRLGAIHSAMGHLDEGERHFEWLLGWLTPQRWAALRFLAGHDFTAACLAFSAVNQWFLGHPETALARATEAMTGSVARGETMGQAFAFGYGAATLFLVRVGDEEMGARVEYLHRLTQQENFGAWRMYADVFEGRMMALSGDQNPLAGLRCMQTAVAAWRDAGLVPDIDILTTVLADTCLTASSRLKPNQEAARAELLDAGLAAVETTLAPEQVPCGPHWSAELHRLRGELLLARHGLAASPKVLRDYETALQVSGERGLPSVELRAATSQVRMRELEPGVAELVQAKHCLRDVYARFTEGLAFPDLKEAAALLDETHSTL